MKKFYVLLLLTLCFSFRLDAKWTKSKDSIGGRVTCLASSDNRIFAGAFRTEAGLKTGSGVGSGIYYSDNNGENWTKALHNTDSIPLDIESITFCDKYIYVGSVGQGVFVSNNNGIYWTQVDLFPDYYIAHKFAVIGSNVFAATDFGVFRFSGNGFNWDRVAGKGLPSNANRSIIAVENKLYVTSSANGVFVSDDNGENWTAVNNGLSNLSVLRLLSVDNSIFAWTPSGLFRFLPYKLEWMLVEFDDLSADTELNYIVGNGSNYYIATNKGVYVSSNYGASCTQVNEGLENLNVWKLLLTNSHLVASTDDGIYSMPLNDINKVEEIAISSISISPQPVKNEAVVTLNAGSAHAGISLGISIELYDLKGTIVATYNFTSLNEGMNKLRLDVSNIPSGMYNAVIKNGAEVHNAKLIKID